MINIASIKMIVDDLPEEITGEQFDDLWDEMECLRAEKIKQDQEELRALLIKANELQAKLGLKPAIAAAPEPAKPSRREDPDQTDYSAGIGRDADDDVTVAEFRAELMDLKDRTREKRRRMA